MILRPGADAELIDCAVKILADGSTPLDTRTMLALLILDKRLKVCPPKNTIVKLLAGLFPRVSAGRMKRMIHDAEAAGYFVPSCGQLDGRPGRRWRYWYIVSAKPEICS